MIWLWDSAKKKYLKRVARKVQREIYQAEFNISIIDNLVIGFSQERLKHLRQKQAEWTAKEGGVIGDKKKIFDALKEFKDDILREENAIKGAEMRKKDSVEGIRVREGKLKFIKDYLKGKYD